ncbi:MAG: TIGR03757 family integrating conjugative element protein [Geminicoccales bacterium]
MSPAFRGFALCSVSAMLLSSAALASEQQPSSIEVFTTFERPANGNRIESVIIYEVDGLTKLTESLSENLPDDAEAAKEIALQRISRLGDELRWTVEHAVEGLTRAKKYDLDRYPAVVFDKGKSVVYGVANVDQALKIYQQQSQ